MVTTFLHSVYPVVYCSLKNASVAQGMQTFLRCYKTLTQSGRFHNARLASALHRDGCFGGTIKVVI